MMSASEPGRIVAVDLKEKLQDYNYFEVSSKPEKLKKLLEK